MEKEIVSRAYQVVQKLEERAENNSSVFRGDAIRFNEWSHNLGGFREMIVPSAWDTADTSECLAVFNHREDYLLGSANAGTLRFRVHSGGVETEIDKANTTISRDCSEWVSRGEVTGQSFKFIIEEDEWVYDDKEDILRRTITKLGKIYDTSLVTRPAYPTTTIERGIDLAEIRSRLMVKVEVELEESKETEDPEKELEEVSKEMRSTSDILYNYFLNKHKARGL